VSFIACLFPLACSSSLFFYPSCRVQRRLAAPDCPCRHVLAHTVAAASGRMARVRHPSTGSGHHFDLAVIGTGSGNSIVDERFAGRRVAFLEKGTFGGTCLNVGCIPTKMFVHPADVITEAAHAQRLGLRLGVDEAVASGRLREAFGGVRDRIFRRIDPISVAGRNWRAERNADVTLFEGHARFTGPRELDTGTGTTITADQIVIAAGSRAVIPDIPGLEGSPAGRVHTSDTVMRIHTAPRRLVILGGGFVAAEFAHVFGSFGSQVTVVNRSGALLRREDADVSARFTELARRQWDVRLDTEVVRVDHPREDPAAPGGPDDHLLVHLSTGERLEADLLLVATGRHSNADGLALHRAGVEVDDDGLVVVDARQHTTADGIWALGDVSNPYQLKHVSNHEARVVQHNLLHPRDPVESDHRFVPSAVFSSPQVASVGVTEEDARERDLRFVTSRQAYGDTAYGWAMEDNTSFVKLLADPGTGLLLGAHLLGPQAATLIQPLVQAMAAGQTAAQLARGQYWIHPALTEVVENALLGLATGQPATATPG
jgi:mycothione reductase